MTQPETHTFGVHLPGLLTLLSDHLYANPSVAVRECVQNAYDAILRRWMSNTNFAPYIRIRLDGNTITFEDNGAGLTKTDLHTFVATVGNSLTRTLDDHTTYDYIGMFGLGLLSAFAIADHVEIVTRSVEASQAYHWQSSGDGSYTIQPADRKGAGTAVKLHLKVEGFFLLNPGLLAETIRYYADFLPVPIYINASADPINRQHAPWHPESSTDILSYLIETRDYDPLLTVPLHPTDDVDLKGVAFIPPGAVLSVHEFGECQVYVRRMLITEQERDLLPRWARFISAIIESADLQPTASREALQKNEAYYALQAAVERQLLDAFVRVSQDDPRLWRALVRQHNDLIMGWALDSPRLFDTVADLVTFRTSAGRITLSAYLEQSDRIYYTADERRASRLRIASAALGVPVVFATRFAEEDFIDVYARVNAVEVTQLEDAITTLFKTVPLPSEEWKLITSYFAQHGFDVHTAAYDPTDLPVLVLKTPPPSEQSEVVYFVNEAETLFGSENARPTLLLNVNNHLLQAIATMDSQQETYTSALEIVLQSTMLWAGHNLSMEEMKAAYTMLCFSLQRLIM